MGLLLELTETFGLGRSDLERIIATAPARYSVYQIPKKHGGSRTIAHPSRETKAIQRYILDQKLSAFPIHPSAMAYVKRRNILENALAHVQSGPILKLDFQDFFHSIRVRDWEQFAKRNPTDGIDLKELALYSKVLFWGRQTKSIVPYCLSIGAPTSPALSNILLYDFDVSLSSTAKALGVQYTRYADDITASGSNLDNVLKFEKSARKLIKALKSPKLVVNEDKRGVYCKGQRRLVTGLVITPTKQVSVGRKRKRTVSSLLHRSTLNQLDIKQRGHLKGMLGFCIANEPSFINRLRAKYGDQVVDSALQFHVPPRAEQGGDL